MVSPMLAVAGIDDFLGQSLALLAAATLIGFISQRLRVVPIVGFLLAGVLIGPNALGLVRDLEVVELAAEVGIILLLFTIGIEFSIERLVRIRRYVLVGGGAKVALAIALTSAVLVPFGIAPRDAVFTGFLLAISSTAIVLKILADRREISSAHGQVSLALLIFEDLAAVAMVLLIPILAGQGGPAEVLRVTVTAVVLIAVVLLLARRVMPRVLESVARLCSAEVFLLAVVAICIGMAWLTNLAGVSVSLGAFLAGLVVSESRHGDHALSEVLPLQIMFSATFFLSIGMLLDVRFLVQRPSLVLAAVAIGLVVPLATTLAATSLLRLGAATVLPASFLLAQVSEFAFVVERAGAAAGLSPAGLGTDGSQAFIAGVVLLMVATPALAHLGRQLAGRVEQRRKRSGRTGPIVVSHPPEGPAGGHVLISGWGPGAQHVAGALQAAGVPIRVVTLDPEGAATAEAEGHGVHLGDSTRRHTLLEAGLADARLLVIADDDEEQARRIAAVATTIVPDTPIVIGLPHAGEVTDLAAAGVTHLVDGRRAGQRALADAVVGLAREPDAAAASTLPVPPSASRSRAQVDTSRIVRFAVDPDAACTHAAATVPVVPSSPGCEQCLRTGDDWVHLRLCLTCGSVGCCDSSPNRHARAHAEGRGHPVAASAEPDDAWAYCFVDDLTLRRQATEAAPRQPVGNPSRSSPPVAPPSLTSTHPSRGRHDPREP